MDPKKQPRTGRLTSKLFPEDRVERKASELNGRRAISAALREGLKRAHKTGSDR